MDEKKQLATEELETLKNDEKQKSKETLHKLLENARIEDEMIFDHGPLIVGAREQEPKDRFSDKGTDVDLSE